MTFDPINALQFSRGFSLPNLVALGHFLSNLTSGWPLTFGRVASKSWPQICGPIPYHPTKFQLDALKHYETHSRTDTQTDWLTKVFFFFFYYYYLYRLIFMFFYVLSHNYIMLVLCFIVSLYVREQAFELKGLSCVYLRFLFVLLIFTSFNVFYCFLISLWPM